MLRARFDRGRMVAIASLACLATAGVCSPLAAQNFFVRNVPYNEPTSPGFHRFSSIQPVSHDGLIADDAAATAAPAGDCGCSGGGGGNSCDYGCAAPRGCDRWYVSIMGGWQQRETVHESADARTFIEFDGGFSMNAALGYRFDVFRLEAEYSFMNNECTTAGAAGLSSPTVGNVNLKAFMFNVYHDIDIDGWCWKPYLGAGIGIYQSDLNGLFPDFFQTVGGAFATTPINATSNMPFAYQFRAGASRPLGERTEFFCGYRYFHGEELTFSSAPFAGPGAPVFNPNGAWTHGVEFGLRIKF